MGLETYFGVGNREEKKAESHDPAHPPNVLQRASDLPKLNSNLHTSRHPRARVCVPKRKRQSHKALPLVFYS